MYENNGDGTFIWRDDLVFPGFRYAASAWADINGNGYPDLIITGRIGNTRTTSLYINENGNSFLLQENTPFPAVERGSVAWGDYDGDGMPDLLITGIGVTEWIGSVYRNTGNNSFEFTTGLTAVGNGEGIWTDLNNNGLLDIVISGAIHSATGNDITKVYLNNGNGTFSEVFGLDLLEVRFSSVKAVDINNNGKTDLAISGFISNIERETRIYMNGIDLVNTIPSPPDSLNSEVNCDHVLLSWNNGSDVETADTGLSYNIWLQPDDEPSLQLMAPMAEIVSGTRRVSQPGNAGFGNSYQLTGLSAGNYQWAIQTVDSAHAGSLFSSWQSFYIPPVYLPAPSNVILTEIDSQFYLSWDEVAQADLYRIFGSADPSAENWQELAVVDETEWVIPVYHARFFFRVVAVSETE